VAPRINAFNYGLIEEELVSQAVHHGPKKLSVAFCYPNNYSLGMSNLGFQMLYSRGLAHKAIFADRFFADAKIASRYLSVSKKMDLRQFDVIIFSISYELDYIQMAMMLEESGIAAIAATRNADAPLVIAGGIAPTINPLTVAQLADAVFLGEGDALVDVLFNLLLRDNDKSKLYQLEALANEMQGIYVPLDLHRVNLKNTTIIPGHYSAFASSPPATTIFSPQFAFASMLLLETVRGCQGSCRFCAAGFVLRPFRSVSPSVVFSLAEKNKAFTQKIGLVGASVLDHPAIDEILEGLIDRKISLTVSSVRASAASPEIMNLLAQGGMKSVAFAPETASIELRNAINKHFTYDELEQAVINSLDSGIKRIKLYYMVGLPGEIDEDILKNVREIEKVFKTLRSFNQNAHLSVTASVFVPKLGTPLQWCDFIGVEGARQRLELFKKELRQAAPGVYFLPESPKEAALQAIFAEDDGSIGKMLPTIIAKGSKYQHFKNYATEMTNKEAAIRMRADLIAAPVREDFLINEYKSSLARVRTSRCHSECSKCGACAQGVD
jgi:radical SAM superfamily enzyme YgiQ (UPF0313 family)